MPQRIKNNSASATHNTARSTQVKRHLIRRGDTLSEVAQHYALDLDVLLKANPQIKDPDLIFAGQILEIPNNIKELKESKTKSTSHTKQNSAQDRLVDSTAERSQAQVARDSVPADDARLDDKKSLGLTGLIAQNKQRDGSAKSKQSTSIQHSQAASKVNSLKTLQDQVKADQDPRVSTKGAAQKISKALDRFDVNDAEIERVLSQRSQAEISQIKQDFKSQSGQDLDQVLSQKLDKTELRRAQLLMQGNDRSLPKRDAEMLEIAMQGLGTDERLVLDTLYGKSTSERAKISTAYQKRTGRSLEQDIKSEHSGRAEIFALATLKRGKIDDADRLQAAMSGLGTDTDALFAALQNKSPEQLATIQKNFQAHYGRDLSSALDDELSRGDKVHAHALLRKGKASAADTIAEELAGHWSNDRKILDTIEQLNPKERQEFITEFTSQYGDLGTELKKGLSDTAYNEAMTTINKGSLSPAQKLNRAMRGLGTDEEAVYSTLKGLSAAERSEVKSDYQRRYGKSLSAALHAEFSGMEKERVLRLLDKGTPDLADAIEFEIRDGAKAQSIDKLLQDAPAEQRQNLEKTYQKRFGRSVHDALNGSLSGRDLRKANLLLDQGFVSPRQRADLAMQGMGTREEDLFAALASATPEERQAMRADSKFLQTLASELSGSDFAHADTLLKKGKLSREESLHFAMAGPGTDEATIQTALTGLNAKQRQQVQDKYLAKYHRPLLNDLQAELGQRDFWAAQKALEAPATGLRERADRVAGQAARERNSGSVVGRASDALMDLVSQNGFEVDQSLREYHRSLNTAQSDTALNPEKAAILLHQEQNIATHTSHYLNEKQAVAETAGQVATMAAAAVATTATGGLAAPAAMAIIATTAGATKVATKQLIVGDSYELNGAEGAKDFAVGAVEGLSSYATANVSNTLSASLGKRLLASQGKDVSKKGLMMLGHKALKASGEEVTRQAIKRASQKELVRIGQDFIKSSVSKRIGINAAFGAVKGATWSAPRAAIKASLDEHTADMEIGDAMKFVLGKTAEAAATGAKNWAVGSATLQIGSMAAESAKTRVFVGLGKKLAKNPRWNDKKVLSAAYEALGDKSKGLSRAALMHTGRQKLYAELGERAINSHVLGRTLSIGAQEVIKRGTAAQPSTLFDSLGDHDTWQYGVDGAFAQMAQTSSKKGAKTAAAFGVANMTSELTKGMRGHGTGAAQAGLSNIIWRTIATMWR